MFDFVSFFLLLCTTDDDDDCNYDNDGIAGCWLLYAVWCRSVTPQQTCVVCVWCTGVTRSIYVFNLYKGGVGVTGV